MLRVGHYVDRYPVSGHDYIYAQVDENGDRRDRLLAGRGTSHQGSTVPISAWTAFDGAPYGPLGTVLAGQTRDRIVDRLWPARYLRQLGDFVLGEVARWELGVLHAHFGMAGAKIAAAGHRAQVPVATTFYGVDASACLQDPRWLGRFQPLFATGDLFVVLSDSVVGRLAAAGCPADRIVVQNLTVDFSELPDSPAVTADGTARILCAARFVEKKGHHLLIDALRQVRTGRDVTLTLIGYGPLLPRIRAQVEANDLGPHVSIIDMAGRTDFDALFRRALATHHLFVLPSVVATDGDDEAGPALTAIQAQGSGMPAVLTRFVGAERSVVEGETGLFADADPGSIAAAIERVLADPGLASRLGTAGRELVRREFSLEAQRQAMAGHYERLVADRTAHAAT